MNFIWDLYQHFQIKSVLSKSESAASRAAGQNLDRIDEIRELSKRLDFMSLACTAMWELVQEKHGFITQDLQAKIIEVDARDGKVDGRMGVTIKACVKCERPLHPKHENCLYCGAENKRHGPFR
jgi:hypothetical protein